MGVLANALRKAGKEWVGWAMKSRTLGTWDASSRVWFNVSRVKPWRCERRCRCGRIEEQGMGSVKGGLRERNLMPWISWTRVYMCSNKQIADSFPIATTYAINPDHEPVDSNVDRNEHIVSISFVALSLVMLLRILSWISSGFELSLIVISLSLAVLSWSFTTTL
jgi:hypothetical protein